MKQKLLTETPVCSRERLIIISYTTGLSFALEKIGPLVAIVITSHQPVRLHGIVIIFWHKIINNIRVIFYAFSSWILLLLHYGEGKYILQDDCVTM
jgi:hypothetical protein